MTTVEMKGPPKPSAAARTQAAAWIARLHGPNRTENVEVGLRRWLSESPEHAAAFELLTDTWEKSARIRRRPMDHMASMQLVGIRLSFYKAAFAAAAVAALAVVGTLFYLHNDAVVTAVGEQRTLALEDGTRVYLNTDTRAVVHYDRERREIVLEKGEALFEVAKRSNWPFVVRAGGHQVRALGTAFIVRRDDENVAVTLVEGKVAVSPIAGPDAAPRLARKDDAVKLADRRPLDRNGTVTLAPGQRLTFGTSESPTLDRPHMDRVTAWQRGQVAFDNTPLADAAAEMNRYSAVRLIVEDPRAAAIRVSGLFRAGDSENFAKALARTYRLQAREESHEIILAGEGVPAAIP